MPCPAVVGARPKSFQAKSSKNAEDRLASNPDQTSGGSSDLQDCFFYQIKTCGRMAKCPFLHRTFPGDVCRLFLFKKCKDDLRCPKQHLSPSSLPAPSVQEEARVRSVRQGREEVPQYVYKKRGARERGAGNVEMRNSVNESEKSKIAPEIKAFECLDCEVASTSCFLLENHLNSEEHWNRMKQIKMEGTGMKGVVGDRTDFWSKEDERDWTFVRKEKKAETVVKDYIHVCNIPLDMTFKKLKQICLQYGEVSKLKMLPMYGDRAQHAFVRYTTEEGKEFAANKLKKLQKSHFVGASELLLEKAGQDDEIAEGDSRVVTNVKMEKMTADLHQQKLSLMSDQLQQMTLAREEQETKLLLCRTNAKICKLNGAGPDIALKLLEEELDIQRNLRDLECAAQHVKKEMDIWKSKILSSMNQSDIDDSSGAQFYHPDDLFNSDDEEEFNEDMIDQNFEFKLKNMMSPQLSEEQAMKEHFKDLYVNLPTENRTRSSDDVIGQHSTVWGLEDVLESTKAIVRSRKC